MYIWTHAKHVWNDGAAATAQEAQLDAKKLCPSPCPLQSGGGYPSWPAAQLPVHEERRISAEHLDRNQIYHFIRKMDDLDFDWWPTTTTTMSMTAISMTLSAKSSALRPGWQLLPTLIWLLVPSTSTSIALHFSLHSPTSHLLSSFFCCCWGAHLRSRSFHHRNHLFALLVVVL